MTSKKEVEIKRGDSLFGGDHGGPGAPWEGDLGGGIMDYGLEVLYLDTPMGQRPGEFMLHMLWTHAIHQSLEGSSNFGGIGL